MSLPSTLALMTGYFFSAATAALTKKLMKPSLTPCSFSNFSWNFLRISITGAMFTSLKVVRMALVDWDCTRRSAMRARRRDIGTRCSGRSPRLGAVGAATRAASLGGRWAGGRRTGPGRRPWARRQRTQHVALGHAAVLAGARHRAGASLLSAISLAAAGMATSPLLAAAAAAQRPQPPGRLPLALHGTALPSVSMRAIT
jgi:hypothetical protein